MDFISALAAHSYTLISAIRKNPIKMADEAAQEPEENVSYDRESIAGDEDSGLEGEESGGLDETYESEEQLNSEELSVEEEQVGEESTPAAAKKPARRLGILEYDLQDMYPEMAVLVQKTKRDWNYQDPDVIRAMWLESRTNILQEWKVKNAKIKSSKNATIEPVLNHTTQLRLESLKQKEEQRKAEFRKRLHMLAMGRMTPQFDTVKMATTNTVEMRHRYNRNNPPIPGYYIKHYDKFKKPPFITKTTDANGCLPGKMSR